MVSEGTQGWKKKILRILVPVVVVIVLAPAVTESIPTVYQRHGSPSRSILVPEPGRYEWEMSVCTEDYRGQDSIRLRRWWELPSPYRIERLDIL